MNDQSTPDAAAEGLTDEAAMGAAWDRLTAEGIDPEPAEATDVEAAPDAETQKAATEDAPPAEEKPEEPAPVVEAPSFIPASLKAQWGAFTPEQRNAIEATQRDVSARMADQGRVVKAAKPVYDVLVEAAQRMPSLRDMTPAAIAQDMLRMATVADDLARDPVGTVLKVAKDYGALDGLRAALAGQAPDANAQGTQALMAEVRDLRRQLASVADPAAIEQRIMATLSTREAETTVARFAAKQEMWSDVEAVMPQFVALAQSRLGANASAEDVLSAAYDMAVHAVPDVRAKLAKPATPPPPPADPAKVAGQLKAKAVNVSAVSSGRASPMTERQKMAAVWDRHAS